MAFPPRPIAYVLAATNHGSMIVNRNDHSGGGGKSFGVGFELLDQSAFDPDEVAGVLEILDVRRRHFGDGLVALDGGANIGVHTIEWARHMFGWGRVLSFEAQEYVFYALAGNIALNNCWNASARWCALGGGEGSIDIPEPDYLRPGSFGSLELRRLGKTEYIGQQVSYDHEDLVRTPMVSVDSLALERLDLLKLDVEGMEIEVLRGARATLERCKPVVLAEFIKSDKAGLLAILRDAGYGKFLQAGMNVLAFHASDPCANEFRGPPLQASA
ncbi:FkbM family methyltransferase [Ramlibacter sp. USB13]|uniref:FkbM family methyltransferase n=1 Tax=Ramlibacter cellulosilyticus TaxID=2764187 RepID=A0A923SB53_9BURK|nr:FkbM family methyltransferase [Ramlibacter cellulosilyticus]MBC5782893.1 FkbM family methyltransferase [Ramlibacter cellulosilyticus]